MRQKILVIEDNEQNLYLLTFILEKAGYRVVSARNGLEGIEMARRERPAAILLDIQLPVMDGYEVARKLRQTEEACHIPIVAVTSYAMVGDREKALESGCTGYLEKPINLLTFVHEVERYLILENCNPGDDE
jgi:two-component system, cell cycle response regulator DivK